MDVLIYFSAYGLIGVLAHIWVRREWRRQRLGKEFSELRPYLPLLSLLWPLFLVAFFCLPAKTE